MNIRRQALQELTAAVTAAVDVKTFTLAEVSEEFAHELCDQGGHVLRQRLRGALVAWAEPLGLTVGDWDWGLDWSSSSRHMRETWSLYGDARPSSVIPRRIGWGALEVAVASTNHRIAVPVPRRVNEALWDGAPLSELLGGMYD